MENDMNDGIGPYAGDGAPQDETRLSRPSGRYDNIVNLIVFFPLRLVLFFVFAWGMLNFETTYDSFWGVFGQPILAILALVEICFAPVSALIKGFLVKAVMRAERNAKEL